MRKLISILSTALIVLSLFALGGCMRTAAAKGRFGYKMAQLSEIFCPPDDLFEPLLIKRLDITQTGVKTFQYRHKYVGAYEIQLVLSHLESFFASAEAFHKRFDDLDLEIEFAPESVKGKRIIINRDTDFQGFWGWTYQGRSFDGLTVFIYSVPDYLPRDEWINITVKVNSQAKITAANYGQPSLVIMIRSEE